MRKPRRTREQIQADREARLKQREQRQAEKEARRQELARLRELIIETTAKLPAGLGRFDYLKTVDFKAKHPKWISKARKVRPSVAELHAVVSELSEYYKG